MCQTVPFLNVTKSSKKEREENAESLHMQTIVEPVQGTRKDDRVKVTVSKAYTPGDTRQSPYGASEKQLL